MEPAATAVTFKEAGVIVPLGVGCRIGGTTGATLLLLEDPHPGTRDPATRATVPCMTWRRVRVENPEGLHGNEMPVIFLTMDARLLARFDSGVGTLRTGGELLRRHRPQSMLYFVDDPSPMVLSFRSQ